MNTVFRGSKTISVALFTTLISLCDVGHAAVAAEPQAANQLDATCLGLSGKTIAEVKIKSARRIEADPKNQAPGMCEIFGTRAPYLDMFVVVPDSWSGRMWQVGGGGFDGYLMEEIPGVYPAHRTMMSVLVNKRGAIYAASNGGNRAKVADQAAPRVWVDGTPEGEQSRIDYAYAAIGKTTKFAKAIANEFFGRSPTRTYFSGCSNGARNAVIATDRWPDEFDGIVAGCLSLNMTGAIAAWANFSRFVGTPAMPTEDQWSDMYASFVSQCDAEDGLKDDIVANYAGCKFDVETRQCGKPNASKNPGICLSVDQVRTVRTLTTDLRTSTGKLVFSGWLPQRWPAPHFDRLTSAFMALASGDVAWLDKPSKRAAFDLDRNLGPLALSMEQIGANQDLIALASFIAAGKKVIHWHDSADSATSLPNHARTVAELNRILRSMGVEDTSSGSRFFVVPGTDHLGGTLMTNVDWSKALIDWVEKGKAPSQLTFRSTTASGSNKTIPVCQYPMYPRYVGGDVKTSSSYSCTNPN